MEGLLRFSKFKLQLLALIAENSQLRGSERSARDELRLSVQRQRESETEFSRKLQELQADLASRDELRRKLEARMKYLENGNAFLEKKHKEMKESLDNLLKSRDSFMNIYEDSTCALKSAIEIRDRKLSILSDKMQRHLSLFDSIEKEAGAIKQIVDSIQQLVCEKEQVVTRLKEKMDKLSTYEKEFVDKMCSMESELSKCQHELQRKDTIVLELKEELEAAKNNIILQSQVEEFQKALVMKDEIIHSLTSEKKGLHLELLNMELMLRKIQDTVVLMCAESHENTKSSSLEIHTVKMARGEGNIRFGRIARVLVEDSPSKTHKETAAENPVIVSHQDNDTSNRNTDDSCTSEVLIHSSPREAFARI